MHCFELDRGCLVAEKKRESKRKCIQLINDGPHPKPCFAPPSTWWVLRFIDMDQNAPCECYSNCPGGGVVAADLLFGFSSLLIFLQSTNRIFFFLKTNGIVVKPDLVAGPVQDLDFKFWPGHWVLTGLSGRSGYFF